MSKGFSGEHGTGPILPSTSSPDRSIIYQNNERTVTLLDIPTSIAVAQGGNSNIVRKTIYSCEPLQNPFRDNEPKSIKAKEQSDLRAADSGLDSIHASVIGDALTEVRSRHHGAWCLPRRWQAHRPRKTKKRKAEQANIKQSSEESIETKSQNGNSSTCEGMGEMGEIKPTTLESMLTKLVHRDSISVSSPVTTMSCSATSATRPISDEEANNNDVDSLLDRRPWEGVFHNPLQQQLDLTLDIQNGAADGRVAQFRFHVPEQSTFLLGDCSDTSEFRNSLRHVSQEYDIPRTFDFILLDPPWPNASAKRAKAYGTKHYIRDMKPFLLRMDLDAYMAPGCFVGVWVTNSPGVRSLVLEKGGLFEAWNVCLKEEWLWAKTTTKGEPTTPLDGLWRKPYESLLLGQRPNDPLESADPSDSFGDVKRRVIIAVQDLHSRKPCLKRLIEPLMADRHSYRALEVFARHLVAGWWSWGDEALKFNCEDYWTSEN